MTAVVDWAASRNIGFSHVISLGDMADVDFGDMLDYLAGDTQSRAILIYMEALTNAPKFISAARRAARVKPVIVVKSGRHEAGARAAMSHTGALAGQMPPMMRRFAELDSSRQDLAGSFRRRRDAGAQAAP